MTTLARIRSKVRQLTARKSTVQLTDAELDFQINNWYQYSLPLELRNLDLREEYKFITQPNIDVYNVSPNTYTTFEPTMYVSGYQGVFLENRTVFHNLFPDIRTDVLVDTGDGTVGPYSGTIEAVPILKSSLTIYAQSSFNARQAAVENGDGNLYRVGSNNQIDTSVSLGTINYETGVFSLTYETAIPSGNEVRASYYQYLANRPTTVLYFDNQLIFRPVPDKAYDIRMIAYLLPTALASVGSSPQLNEWWEALAYGAATKILENNRDFETMAKIDAILQEKLTLLGRRQWYQTSSQQTKTIYNQPSIYPGPWPYGYFGGNYW